MLGVLSILAVPAGIAASRLTDRVDLVAALAASAAVGIVLGLGSIYARRVARRRHRRSLQPDERPLGGVRWLGWLGLYLGVMGGLALGVYALLRLSE